jgi:hypothetical protein
MRTYPESLGVGAVIPDGMEGPYRIVRVRQPAADGGLGHAWADPVTRTGGSDEPASD